MYAKDAPTRLPLHELVAGLLRRLARGVRVAYRVGVCLRPAGSPLCPSTATCYITVPHTVTPDPAAADVAGDEHLAHPRASRDQPDYEGRLC